MTSGEYWSIDIPGCTRAQATEARELLLPGAPFGVVLLNPDAFLLRGFPRTSVELLLKALTVLGATPDLPHPDRSGVMSMVEDCQEWLAHAASNESSYLGQYPMTRYDYWKLDVPALTRERAVQARQLVLDRMSCEARLEDPSTHMVRGYDRPSVEILSMCTHALLRAGGLLPRDRMQATELSEDFNAWLRKHAAPTSID